MCSKSIIMTTEWYKLTSLSSISHVNFEQVNHEKIGPVSLLSTVNMLSPDDLDSTGKL